MCLMKSEVSLISQTLDSVLKYNTTTVLPIRFFPFALFIDELLRKRKFPQDDITSIFLCSKHCEIIEINSYLIMD